MAFRFVIAALSVFAVASQVNADGCASCDALASCGVQAPSDLSGAIGSLGSVIKSLSAAPAWSHKGCDVSTCNGPAYDSHSYGAPACSAPAPASDLATLLGALTPVLKALAAPAAPAYSAPAHAGPGCAAPAFVCKPHHGLPPVNVHALIAALGPVLQAVAPVPGCKNPKPVDIHTSLSAVNNLLSAIPGSAPIDFNALIASAQLPPAGPVLPPLPSFPSSLPCRPAPVSIKHFPDVKIQIPVPAEIPIGKFCACQKYAARPTLIHCNKPSGKCGCGCA